MCGMGNVFGIYASKMSYNGPSENFSAFYYLRGYISEL